MKHLSPKDIQLIDFLVTRQPSKELIETIVNMIPDREFYYPELENAVYTDYQKDIHSLVLEARNDSKTTAYANSAYLTEAYHKDIQKLVTTKRKLLVFGILLQEENKRREILLDIIQTNRLQNRVLALRERFKQE